MSRGSTAFERARPPDSVVEQSLAHTRSAPFWLDEIGDEKAYPTLTAELTADLAIVGGGYCGLWTAVRAKLRRPEQRVVLLEARTVGWAASGRNGGFCDASLTHGEENGRSRWPDENDALIKLGLANLDEIEAAVGEFGIDCQFERTGTLEVATEPHQVEWLREETSGELLDTDAIRAEVSSPTYLAGRWHRETTALVHPARLAKELARVATELGVEIFERTPVEGLRSDARNGPIVLPTPQGRVRAGRVALATNVFPSLLRRYRLHTVPVYDYALMTEPLSDAQLGSIGWGNRQGIGDVANQFHYYRLSQDNRILWGGYDAVYHFGRRVKAEYERRPQTHRLLASHFFSTFPQLEGLAFTHQWAGAIDTSTRFCPFFATAMKGRVAHVSGFTGLGVGSTHFAANVMLDLLFGEETERTRLRMVREKPLPFPPEPAAVLGINATRWSLNRADHRQGRRNAFLRTLDAAGLGFDS